jgi:serpin B
MTVIVPDEGRFAEVEQRLDGSTLTSLVGDLQRGSVDVSLPKFGFTTEVPLTDALRDLGLGTAMDSATADFSTISAEPLWFTAMLHQTYLGIAEQGTEATASKPRSPETTTRPRPVDTAVDDTGLSPGGPTTTAPTALRPASSPDAVVVDRPFLVLVRDRVTGAPLFYGRVLSPNG